MSVAFEINGKKLEGIRSAARLTGYSRDYITRLAREQKIVASQIGRQWFIDTDSLMHHKSVMALEQTVRQQQLSEERKRERQATQATIKKSRTSSKRSPVVSKHVKRVAVAGASLAVLAFVVVHYAPLSLLNRHVSSASLMEQVSGMFGGAPAVHEVPVAPAPETISDFASAKAVVTDVMDMNRGVLLVPHASSADAVLEVADMFSDDVATTTDENGLTYVVRYNEAGEVVEKIPYVMVPVNLKTP